MTEDRYILSMRNAANKVRSISGNLTLDEVLEKARLAMSAKEKAIRWPNKRGDYVRIDLEPEK